ncbi:hypothetical protein GCM10010520_23040 [Rhizobium viscosum]|uniref:ParB-like N-terminal domain-containing protein n=1 Tax=Rhizobium viscosum TaxID=1673 RepID=A0ABR9IIT2_RHIVS|nr:ParB/Srx family N-terminal domain-containing protein [Rhizobium viscosum]MBE1503078.1 hypothetical protein [Rhizobium viscosum]
MDTITMTTETAVAQLTINIRHEDESIALNRLMPSAGNVRRVNATAGLSELADSIEAHGLIHKLTVRKGKKGKYEVIAGSRRLGALRLLAKEGRLAEDAPIPCTLRQAGDSTEISLAENVQRGAMHWSMKFLPTGSLPRMAWPRRASRRGSASRLSPCVSG